jgi:hypothetical protein
MVPIMHPSQELLDAWKRDPSNRKPIVMRNKDRIGRYMGTPDFVDEDIFLRKNVNAIFETGLRDELLEFCNPLWHDRLVKEVMPNIRVSCYCSSFLFFLCIKY